MKQCATCEYFSPQPIQSTPAHKSGKGFCCRYPPRISEFQVGRFFVEGYRGCELGLKCSWWPAVDEQMGCGEYRKGGGDE